MLSSAVELSATTTATAEAAFGAIAPIDLTLIFRRFGPIPAVVGTREQTGAWDHAGAERVVELSDGSETREHITAYDAPRHFAYRVGPFAGPLGRLVEHADGAWWFAADGTIRWRYEFEPRPGLRLLVSAFVVPMWRAYARRALALAVEVAERA